jgi:hypothetical protein
VGSLTVIRLITESGLMNIKCLFRGEEFEATGRKEGGQK